MKFRALPAKDWMDPFTGEYLYQEDTFVYGYLVRDNKGNPFIVGDVVEACEEYINFKFWVPVVDGTIGQYVTTFGKYEVYEGDLFQDEAGREYTIRYDEEQGAFIADEPEDGWVGIDDVRHFEQRGNVFDGV